MGVTKPTLEMIHQQCGTEMQVMATQDSLLAVLYHMISLHDLQNTMNSYVLNVVACGLVLLGLAESVGMSSESPRLTGGDRKVGVSGHRLDYQPPSPPR